MFWFGADWKGAVGRTPLDACSAFAVLASFLGSASQDGGVTTTRDNGILGEANMRISYAVNV